MTYAKWGTRQSTYQVCPASQKRKSNNNVFCCVHLFKPLIVVLWNLKVTDTSEKGQTG